MIGAIGMLVQEQVSQETIMDTLKGMMYLLLPCHQSEGGIEK